MKQLQTRVHLVILLILVIVLSSPSLLSGVQKDGSIFLHTGHDVLWHMSVAAEVKRGLPLIYPAMNGVLLTNYHYFTDLAVGIINFIPNIPLFFVYYRFLPLLLISTLVWRIYTLSHLLTKNKFSSTVATVASLISGSAAFLLPILIKKNNWQGGAFMLSPTYTQLVNPHSILGFVILFWGIYYIVLSQESEKFKNIFKASLLFPILFAIKSFYAIPSLIAVSLLSFINIFGKDKSYKFLLPPITSALIVFGIYLLINNGHLPKEGSLTFRPMWLLLKMAEQGNRFPLPELILKRQHFLETGNQIRLLLQNTQLILTFLIGNFWIKLLGIYFLFKSKWKNDLKVFFTLLIIISILVTLSFVTLPDNFNAMQFGRVATIITSWLFGLFVGLRYKKVKAIALLILVSATFWLEFPKYTKTSGLKLTYSEYESLEFIKKETPLDSVFLVDVKKGNNNPLVTGLGERRTYFDDYKTTQLLGLDYVKRSKLQENFFNKDMSQTEADSFIKDNHINYIYFYKPDQENAYVFDYLTKVFQNKSITVYKINRL